MAEESLSKKMRVKDMIQIDTGVLVEQRYLLPSDWQQLDFVRRIGGRGLRYVSRDDFYNTDQPFVDDQHNCYSIAGNYIIVGGTSSAGIDVEIHYYQDIPPLGDEPTWMLTKYPTLYTISTLHIAAMYAIEDDRLPTWETAETNLITEVNMGHQLSKSSGSLLTTRRKRSFG
jgi:hypothetical protein